MKDTMSFDTERLNEIYEELKKLQNEYKDTLLSLDQEVKKLEDIWGTKNSIGYATFKEKYLEKKSKLDYTNNLIIELVDNLKVKKEEIEEMTLSSISSFE